MANSPFKRVSYTEAIEILEEIVRSKKKKFEYKVEWGIDLQVGRMAGSPLCCAAAHAVLRCAAQAAANTGEPDRAGAQGAHCFPTDPTHAALCCAVLHGPCSALQSEQSDTRRQRCSKRHHHTSSPAKAMLRCAAHAVLRCAAPCRCRASTSGT